VSGQLKEKHMNTREKVVVVTGAASGIGEACASQLAESGAKVVLADRDPVRGRAVTARIVESGGAAVFIATDVTQEEAIRAMVALAVGEFGGLDGAVNAAGIADTPTLVTDLTVGQWRQDFEVMLLGVALCMKHEIVAMLKRGGGSVVNIASTGGLGGVPMNAPYSAAKHGVVGATKAAAVENAASGIRVNALCPGLIDTPLFRGTAAAGADYSGVLKAVPMGRFGQPSEIADAALWLLSSRSSFVTGTTIVVDGGLTASTFGKPE
jgi:NAD(P)-dependent dehydrogenase (short-subunit alcohol dehydrogenase family)